MAAAAIAALLPAAAAAQAVEPGGIPGTDDAAAPARPPAPVEGAPPAPPLRLPALDGPSFDLAAAPKVTIVHFFATWCVPCRTELPALARFAARTPQAGVVLVDVAEVEARVRRFRAATPGLDGLAAAPVLMDLDRAAARAWGVSLLPATFVVADGRLALALEGEVAWDDAETARRLAALLPPGPQPTPSTGTSHTTPEER